MHACKDSTAKWGRRGGGRRMSGRPEHQGPPEFYYDASEASKYTSNSRIIYVQSQLAARALALLELPPRSVVLDVGCGSGLSGRVLTRARHEWVGVDISNSMLDIARRSAAGDLVHGDIGERVRFRPGSFDGAVSVSAIQWLCVASTSEQRPFARLVAFFTWLKHALATGARAALQFYPENDRQLQLITAAASKAGMRGGLVIDNPDSTRAKKHFLLVSSASFVPPPALLSGEDRSLPFAQSESDDEGADAGSETLKNRHKHEKSASRLVDDDDGGSTHHSSDDSSGGSSDDSSDASDKEMPAASTEAPRGVRVGVPAAPRSFVVRRRKVKAKNVKDRNWVLRKKEGLRKRGKDVRADSKYTARRRKGGF